MSYKQRTHHRQKIQRNNSIGRSQSSHHQQRAQSFQFQRNESDLFDSILTKFILNLPFSERRDQSRLSFHAQKAFYYYLDVILEFKSNNEIPENGLKIFLSQLRKYAPKSIVSIEPDVMIQKLCENKPTCGAIIMNDSESKVVVIKNKYGLGFPKGKWNQSEKAEECAERQVFEQIGIYIHKKIDPLKRIEFYDKNNVPSVFFIVKGVKESDQFTIDPKQIDDVFWMRVSDVCKAQKRFVGKSRIAWGLFQKCSFETQQEMTFEDFISKYKPSKKQQKQKRQKLLAEGFDPSDINPFLNFKLDHEKLMSVFV